MKAKKIEKPRILNCLFNQSSMSKIYSMQYYWKPNRNGPLTDRTESALQLSFLFFVNSEWLVASGPSLRQWLDTTVHTLIHYKMTQSLNRSIRVHCGAVQRIRALFICFDSIVDPCGPCALEVSRRVFDVL